MVPINEIVMPSGSFVPLCFLGMDVYYVLHCCGVVD
jgi:hypothetical protein